jgi:hypothetical protein
MLKKVDAMRPLAAAMTALVASVAHAAGDSGTGSMGEMQLSGTHFLMILGAMAALGVVIYVVAKFAGR